MIHFDDANKVWSGDLDDIDGFTTWFLARLDRGEYALLAEAVRHLKPRHSRVFSRAIFLEERRHPYRDCRDQQERDRLPLTLFLAELCKGFPPPVVHLLDAAGVCLNDYALRERSLSYFTAVGESCERQGYLIGLARSWMWRGRCLTDMGNREDDLVCHWRAMSIFSHLFTKGGLTEAEARDVAQGLSSVQHQFAIRCKQGDDMALLYNYRALALRDQLGISHLQAGSHHNAAQQYMHRLDYDRALLHFLQAIRMDITGSNDEERRITYSNVGILANELHDHESALIFLRKAATFGAAAYEIHHGISYALLSLKRYDDLLQEFARAMGNDILTPLQRINLHVFALEAVRQKGDAARAAELVDQLIDRLVATGTGPVVADEAVVARIRARLQLLPPTAFRERAALLMTAGDHAAARSIIEAGLAEGNAGGEEAGLLRAMAERLSKPAEAGPAPDAAPTEAAAATDQTPPCRACRNPIRTAGKRPEPDADPGLCPLCQQALALEDMVEIPAGRVVARDCLEADVAAFRIDRFPVTNRLFRLYHEACKLDWEPLGWKDWLWNHPRQPMTCVLPKDCDAFCAWRSRLNRRRYRLPTQEEWFRAALGSDGRTYPWGDEPPDYTRAAFSVIEDREAVPPPVGMFPAGASPFGVMDMAGTVWEYTATTDKHGKVIYLGGSCDCEASSLTPNQELYRSLIGQSFDERTDRQMGFRCVAEVDGHV